MPDYYDRDGLPISLELWTHLFQDNSYIRVISTELHLGPSNRALISTIWLGLDHNFYRFMNLTEDPPPHIFETMIFHKAGHLNEEQYRYSTEEEAITHHAELVSFILMTHELEPAK